MVASRGVKMVHLGGRGPEARGARGPAGRHALAVAALAVAAGCARKPDEAPRPVPSVAETAVATPSALGLPPRPVPDRFYLDVQRVDMLAGNASVDAGGYLRVTFAVTWSGAKAAAEVVDPVLFGPDNRPHRAIAGSPYPRPYEFPPGAPQEFVATFAGVAAADGVRLRPLAGAEASLELTRALQGKPGHVAPWSLPKGTRTASGDGWAMAVPLDWEEGRPEPPVVATFRSREAPAGLPASIGLSVERFDGDLAAFVARAAAARPPGSAGPADVDPAPLVVHGATFRAVSSKGEIPSPRGAVAWQSVQYVAVQRGHGYVLSCVAPGPAFAAFRPLCDVALATLRLGL